MSEWKSAALSVLAVLAILASWMCPVHHGPENWPIGSGGNAMGWSLAVAAFVLLIMRLCLSFHIFELWPILAGVAINLGFNALVVALHLPLCLDTVGTVVVGVWLNSHAGAATGVASVLLAAIFNPGALAFASVHAFVGMAAGVLAQVGGLYTPLTSVLSGLIVGVPCAVLSAPLNVIIYGEAIRGESGLDDLLRNILLLGPADKALAFALAWVLLAVVVAKPAPARHATLVE